MHSAYLLCESLKHRPMLNVGTRAGAELVNVDHFMRHSREDRAELSMFLFAQDDRNLPRFNVTMAVAVFMARDVKLYVVAVRQLPPFERRGRAQQVIARDQNFRCNCQFQKYRPLPSRPRKTIEGHNALGKGQI